MKTPNLKERDGVVIHTVIALFYYMYQTQRHMTNHVVGGTSRRESNKNPWQTRPPHCHQACSLHTSTIKPEYLADHIISANWRFASAPPKLKPSNLFRTVYVIQKQGPTRVDRRGDLERCCPVRKNPSDASPSYLFRTRATLVLTCLLHCIVWAAQW